MKKMGRDPDTIAVYERHVHLAYEHPRGVMGRITDKKLAPNTRRTAIAALRVYARIGKDDRLYDDLLNVKKPPKRRLEEKLPLEHEDWLLLREEIDTSLRLTRAQRAALGIMATRGFRLCDVLRMTRREVQAALRTGVLISTTKGGRRTRFTTKRFKKYLVDLVEYTGWDQVWDLVSPYAGNPKKAAPVAIQRKLKLIAEDCELDPETIYTHRFRRTYAVEFLNAAGGNIHKLMKHMQWSSMVVAESYTDHIEDETLDDIADEID